MSPDPAEIQSLDPLEKLKNIIPRLYAGAWQLIQLRGAPLSCDDINRGDVDFLTNQASLTHLLTAAYSWVQDGLCHAHIVARDKNKTTLRFISVDGLHWIQLDLWIYLWQIGGKTRYLRFEHCIDILQPTTSSICRLPLAAEIALYIFHLQAKKKQLSTEQVQHRIRNYISECKTQGLTELNSHLFIASETHHLSAALIDAARQTLATYGLLKKSESASKSGKIFEEAKELWLAAPRQFSAFAVMGCDGSGKTTLIRHLAARNTQLRPHVGKRLYRNSLLYKTLVALVRPLLFTSRDRFDDLLAPFNYFRASVALQAILLLKTDNIIAFDRSLIDFLMINRKTDNPRWHKQSWLSQVIGRRIPTFHLITPYDCLAKRKREITAAGHTKYDNAVFSLIANRIPTDYTLFYNGSDLESSTIALERIINSRRRLQ